MQARGWDGADAFCAYRTWLLALVDDAVAASEDRDR
jgi:hypothetical protein